jgi:Fe2+ transport system protein B
VRVPMRGTGADQPVVARKSRNGVGSKGLDRSALLADQLRRAEEEPVPLRKRLQVDTWPDGRKVFTPLVAFTLMIFTLLYIPCVAAIGVIYRETNSWKWPLFAAFYTTALAWIASFIVFQGGKTLGLS